MKIERNRTTLSLKFVHKFHFCFFHFWKRTCFCLDVGRWEEDVSQSVATFRRIGSLSVCRQRIHLSNAPFRLAFLFPFSTWRRTDIYLSKRYGCRKPRGWECTKHQSMYNLQNSSKYTTDFTKHQSIYSLQNSSKYTTGFTKHQLISSLQNSSKYTTNFTKHKSIYSLQNSSKYTTDFTKHQSMYSLQNSSKYTTDFTKVNTSKIFKERERAETSYKKLQGKNHVMRFNLRRQLTGNCEKILLPLWLTAYLTT